MVNLIKPNILLIVADDLGCCDIGILGNRHVKTPNIDQFAAESTILSHHYSASPMCAPARAALQSGKYPHRTGCIDVATVRGVDRIAPDIVLLPQILNENGYSTGLIGKWHNGSGRPEFHPLNKGYEEFIGFRSGESSYWNWTLEHSLFGEISSNGERYLTDVLTEEAEGYIRRHAQEPFFLQLAYNAPHRPLEAPKEDIEEFLLIDDINMGVATLYAMIKRMDVGVGKILKLLKELELEDNTIVLFTSDNGPDFVGKGEMSLVRDVGFNGHKGDVLEGGIRVPCIIRWPCKIKGHTECKEVIHFIDWMPTLLEAAGVSQDKQPDMDGISVLDVLLNKNCKEREQLFWQWNRYTPVEKSNAAVRLGKWKLYYPPVSGSVTFYGPDGYAKEKYNKDKKIILEPVPWNLGKPSLPKLFDLECDPMEQNDISADYPELTQLLTRQLDEWFEKVSEEWMEKSKQTLVN